MATARRKVQKSQKLQATYGNYLTAVGNLKSAYRLA